MVSDDESSDSSSERLPDDQSAAVAAAAAGRNQKKVPSKKRRRKTQHPDIGKKRRTSREDRLEELKVEQSQPCTTIPYAAAALARNPLNFPPTVASLLASSSNPNSSNLLLDPTFYSAGSEPLRTWMHFSRTPTEAASAALALQNPILPLINPHALGATAPAAVARLPSSSLFGSNSLSILSMLQQQQPQNSLSAAAASLNISSSFADVLNLAMSTLQPRPMDAATAAAAARLPGLSLVAQHPGGWTMLPQHGQPQQPDFYEQTRRFLEASIALDERERGNVTTIEELAAVAAAVPPAAAGPSQEETMPVAVSNNSNPKTPAPRKKPKLQQQTSGVAAAAITTTSSSKRVLLALPEDNAKLNAHQAFLRRQIEVFQATEDDILSHTRGRNKPVMLGQVGIRCRHCGHLPVSKRRKGSTYFPSSLIGIYQASQNLCVEHLFSGVCQELPAKVREHALQLADTKAAASIAGKPYWASGGKRLGLVDTEFGIRFQKDDDDVDQAGE